MPSPFPPDTPKRIVPSYRASCPSDHPVRRLAGARHPDRRHPAWPL